MNYACNKNKMIQPRGKEEKRGKKKEGKKRIQSNFAGDEFVK